MLDLTRRSFIAGTAVIPFSVWLEQNAGAAGPATHVRPDARSSQGQAMLKTYAMAVKKMKATASSDPTSWVFQSYTHWVKGAMTPAPKAAAIAQIFPSPSPHRDLAVSMWDTCQAHGPGEDENNFLPWHRMFVYFFERIIRSVSADPTFALPYWNYSTSDKTIRGVLPPEFRKSGDPVFGSLFVENRNPGVNSGNPIQKGQPNDPLSLNALAECPYESSGVDPGFCQGLDFGLHGNVHVLVGSSTNMGAVPFAANDPIFWMHHSNIDRLWTSWNAGGRTNPSLSGAFVFADENGQKVVGNVADFLSLAKLGYTYDHLEPVPKCPPSPVAFAASAQKKHATVENVPVALGADPVHVTLNPLPDPDTKAATPLDARVKSLKPGRRLYLVLRDLRAEEQPGVLFHVYLELPANASPEKLEAHHVGVLNFFHAVGHGGPGHGDAEAKTPGRFYSFDITDLAQRLESQGLLNAKPVVTIAPVGRPAAEAKPVIGDISLVEQ